MKIKQTIRGDERDGISCRFEKHAGVGFLLLLLDENLKSGQIALIKNYFLKEEKKIPTDFRNELEKKTNKNLVVAGPLCVRLFLCVCVCVKKIEKI
jgi:hypothetical protein